MFLLKSRQAFGQIYFMISQIFQKEIEEEEYSEYKNR